MSILAPEPDATWLNLAAAAATLHSNPSHILDMIERGELFAVPEQHGQQTWWRIEPTQLTYYAKLRTGEYQKPSGFAKRWHVSPSTVRRWVIAGHIPADRTLSGRVFIPVARAEAAIRQHATITFGHHRRQEAV